MASNVQIDTSVITKRPQSIASKESTFSFGVSNRLLLPSAFCALFFSFNVSFWFAVSFFVILLIEIVLTYVVKLTLQETFTTLWAAMFQSQRKSIRN
jgi:hypothetical protein